MYFEFASAVCELAYAQCMRIPSLVSSQGRKHDLPTNITTLISTIPKCAFRISVPSQNFRVFFAETIVA